MKPRIIVIEDEAILRMDLKEILTDAGYEVIAEGDNGEKAIELAYQLNPDLMIMDIKMPKMDGLKASKIIKKQSKTPILMLTAFSQKEFVEEAKEANVLGYLVKPISEANLIPAVEIALSQAEKRAQYEDELLQKEQKMNARKQIERAKGVLMKVMKLNEQAAYEKMRKFSMKQQVSLERTAHAILKKYANDM
ncbi:ANTAR domain-containing response regulator [Fictibacillus phosphorivorans]|uniref:ANTAR domain-containing response regulator n=1 Tax=Fictibacillus phosphorivorans TaxID=1221500 RepID=UPI0020409F2B|nr:response regulator [Fictibacillus phosphorivorans]MCM3717801.1 response regulator [Fictibacillus phosphorivorans]MCM3777029.1 response regulator [Fictibacillus phosphorivorans]